jgi:hypothetical protein
MDGSRADLGATLKQMLIRRLLNLVGGILTLGSIAIPWAVIGGNITVSVFQPNAFVWFVPWMILAGGTTSIVSRYGGLLTIAALVSYSVSPPIYFLSTGGPAITSVFGIGFWLAWVGAGLSIVGASWSLPFPPSALRFHKHRA